MKYALTTLLLTMSLTSFAGKHKHEGNPEHRETFKACAQEAGMVRGEKPTEAQKASMKACLEKAGIKKPERKLMDKSTMNAKMACKEELGIKKGTKGKMSKEDKKKFKACLESKGVTIPEKRK